MYLECEALQLILSEKYLRLRHLAYRSVLILHEQPTPVYLLLIVVLVNVHELNLSFLPLAVADALLGRLDYEVLLLSALDDPLHVLEGYLVVMRDKEGLHRA